MDETQIRAVEMVRFIRGALHEETASPSREELKAFVAREAAASRPGGSPPTQGRGGRSAA